MDKAVFSRSPRSMPNVYFVAHGDSITVGFGTTDWENTRSHAYPALVANAALLANPALIFGELNYGINGQGLNYIYPVPPSNTYGTLINDAIARVDPLLSLSGQHKLIIFAGTNDIFLNGQTGASTWALLQTYLNNRISAGWSMFDVCVGTMLPRQNAHEADRTTYNGLIRSNQNSFGYLLADFDTTPMGVAGAENNLTLYSDEIHPTDYGQTLLSPVVQAQLFP